MFFIIVYIHIFRSLLWFIQVPKRNSLDVGCRNTSLMMATAFMGYVLPWGQMSFGEQPSLQTFFCFSVIGDYIVTFLWGRFSVDNPTLQILCAPLLASICNCGVVALHLVALHQFGSSNPTGIDVKSDGDTIPFHPYYTVKDYLGLGVYLIIFAGLVFFAPNFLGHPDNYIPANPLQTLTHIVPECTFSHSMQY